MATIKNLEGLTNDDIDRELSNGAKFVVFQYSISIIIMTFRNSSDIYFVKSGESGFNYGIKYSLVSLVLGWWGIPWGPIYTIGAFITNCSGGKDVTQKVLHALQTKEVMV